MRAHTPSWSEKKLIENFFPSFSSTTEKPVWVDNLNFGIVFFFKNLFQSSFSFFLDEIRKSPRLDFPTLIGGKGESGTAPLQITNYYSYTKFLLRLTSVNCRPRSFKKFQHWIFDQSERLKMVTWLIWLVHFSVAQNFTPEFCL